jgi:hypothetical protein
MNVDRVKMLSGQIVATCEQIVLMTESQIVNYKVNCERYPINAESKTLCFKSQFEDVLKSFWPLIGQKKFKIHFSDDCIKETKFVSDWKVLKLVLFHLILNAIKHGKA